MHITLKSPWHHKKLTHGNNIVFRRLSNTFQAEKSHINVDLTELESLFKMLKRFFFSSPWWKSVQYRQEPAPCFPSLRASRSENFLHNPSLPRCWSKVACDIQSSHDKGGPVTIKGKLSLYSPPPQWLVGMLVRWLWIWECHENSDLCLDSNDCTLTYGFLSRSDDDPVGPYSWLKTDLREMPRRYDVQHTTCVTRRTTSKERFFSNSLLFRCYCSWLDSAVRALDVHTPYACLGTCPFSLVFAPLSPLLRTPTLTSCYLQGQSKAALLRVQYSARWRTI